jgi:hypothetical protein
LPTRTEIAPPSLALPLRRDLPRTKQAHHPFLAVKV